MASVRENKKNGKVVSYCFTAFFGRDEKGKLDNTPLGRRPKVSVKPKQGKRRKSKPPYGNNH